MKTEKNIIAHSKSYKNYIFCAGPFCPSYVDDEKRWLTQIKI